MKITYLVTVAAILSLLTLTIPVMASELTAPAMAQSDRAAGHLPSAPVARTIYQLLSTLKDVAPKAGEWQLDALKKFYQHRDYVSIWLEEDGRWKRDIKHFAEALRQADKEGLNPADYQLSKVASQSRTDQTLQALALHEVQMTNGLLHYIRDLSVGRAHPSMEFPLLFLMPQNRNYATILASILKYSDAEDIEAAFRELAPNHEDYAKLRAVLARYKSLQSQIVSWPAIETDGLIRPGESDSRLPKIRRNMQLLGRLKGQQDIFDNLVQKAKMERKSELNIESAAVAQSVTPQAKAVAANLSDNPTWIYDEVTEKAIRLFQEMSGSAVDGVIGPKTIAELNTPVKDRIRQIELTMERWRWLPESLGNKYVLVNIAGFYTEAVENGNVVIRSPVIVGQVAHQTPAFSSYITNVKFYPDWSVPASIARRYVLGKIQENPEVIRTFGYEIYEGDELLDWTDVDIQALKKSDFPPYRFRQKPGLNNALGRVRFSIKNNYSIYMHDTSDHSLFSQSNRALSAGCIRVQKSKDMAAFLLDGNSNISADAVRQKFTAIGTELKSEFHPLTEKIPVHLVYMTAWIDPQGDVKFGHDIYGRDAKLAKSLTQKKGEL